MVSTAGTSVLAGHNITTDAAAEHTLSTASKDVKKSGIMGAGMGIMIGKKQSKDNYSIDETTHKATTLGSTNGEVTVQAGDTVHLTTTNAVGKDGVIIVGQDIILDGKDDVYKQEERHERKSSGLTVSLGGSVVEKLDSAVKKQHSASNRKNNHFKSLEGKQSRDRLLSALGEAKQIVDRSYNGQMRTIESQLERVNTDIVNTPETDTTKLAELKAKQDVLLKKRSLLEENKENINKATDRAIDRAINIQVGIGSSKSVAESKLERHTYSGGTIDSDGTVLIHANSADSIKGNITAIGEQIKGKNVQLAASNTINLEAGSNTQRVETNSKSSGWNVSANIGMRTGGLVGWSASAYKGSENGIEDTTTHTGTHVVATNNVSIESGSNTNLIGSTISGQGVTAKVGNNLTVESLQDSQIYHETSKNKGISISGANFISQPTINGVNVKGNIDSTYTSVTEQSGIHAGSDGVNIVVGDTTTLKGATITSKATPEKNKISTKSLVMEDIHNEASYKAKKSGIAMNTSGLTAKGVLGKINPLGLSPVVSIPVSDEAQSTTKSAISNDILVEVERKPLTAINSDTEHALNSIKPIFDKADVKERMEYVNAVSDEGFRLIGDLAFAQKTKYELKAQSETDAAMKARYEKEAKNWSEGGVYKVALHGAFGAFVSNLSGGNSLNGLAIGAGNEYLNKVLDKHRDGNLHKWFSTVVGKSLGSTESGIALSATTNNWLTHGDQLNFSIDFMFSKSSQDILIKKLAYYDSLMEFEHAYNGFYKTSNYLSSEVYESLRQSDPDVLTSGRQTAFSDVMYNILQKYIYSQGDAVIAEFEDQKAVQSEKILRDKLDVIFLESRNNRPASTDWRNDLDNIHMEKHSGSDGYYSKQYERNKPKVYENEGDRFADEGAHVITIGGQNYAIVGKDNIEFHYTTRPAQYTEKEFGNALADQMVPVYPPNPPYMTTRYVLYGGKAYSTDRLPTKTIAGTDLEAIGEAYAFQRVGNVIEGKLSGRIQEEKKNTGLNIEYDIFKPQDGVHVNMEYILNTGKERLYYDRGEWGTIDGTISNVNMAGKLDAIIKPGNINFSGEGKFSLLEFEGRARAGNDMLALEGIGTGGIGFSAKYSTSEKVDKSGGTVGSEVSKNYRGFYGSAALKMTSKIFNETDYLKDNNQNDKENKDSKLESREK